MIPGGNLRDIEAIAKHFYYEGQRTGHESQFPLIFMGAVTTAIGASMVFHGGKKMWEERVKAQAKAARQYMNAEHAEPQGHADRTRRHGPHDHGR